MRIDLTWPEMLNAAITGVIRRMSSMDKGLNKNRHASKSDYQTDVTGAIAEACFAKFMDHYWSCSVNTFKAPDVGDWQVRSTEYRDGHLIVRPNDRDGERVAFLVVDGFGATLIGWISVADAKVKCFWREECNSWWVPQDALAPFDEQIAHPA
ncbi:hypothetical protein [Paraburkholderia sp. HD33-4]|uniref:hypothetical protein n=1 Tax=Paraburkholderia sp. HD33-4 TaxID=2883242 RepID=UPI001F454E71|nr:hypothetical protein [Paraburkholderia sp. HD33-4]